MAAWGRPLLPPLSVTEKNPPTLRPPPRRRNHPFLFAVVTTKRQLLARINDAADKKTNCTK